MGLIAEDYKPISDEDLLHQIELALRIVPSGEVLTGGVTRNGPFIRLPIRQVLEVAAEALRTKSRSPKT